jgi:acyl-[acyl-carrier-protein]-phospholipid O-acyltransferase / long-chain-fatty-acid--[acyl-carrier-protein] ligase
VHAIRQAVQELGAITVEKRSPFQAPVPKTFIRQCKRRLFRSKVADTLRNRDDRRATAAAKPDPPATACGATRWPRTNSSSACFLPPAAGSVVVNAALALDRRIACNLNYTVSSDV